MCQAQFYIQHETEVECVSNLRLTKERPWLEFYQGGNQEHVLEATPMTLIACF